MAESGRTKPLFLLLLYRYISPPVHTLTLPQTAPGVIHTCAAYILIIRADFVRVLYAVTVGEKVDNILQYKVPVWNVCDVKFRGDAN